VVVGLAELDGPVSEVVPEAQRASIGRNVAALLTSQAITWSLALVLAIVQPRVLGPSVQGDLRLAVSLWAIAGIVIGLGTSMHLTLSVARDAAAGLELVGPVLVLRCGAFVASAAVLAAYVAATNPTAEFAQIMLVSGIGALFGTLSDAASAAFIGLERMSVIAKVNILTRFVGTITAVGALLAGGGAVAVVAIAAAANAVALAMLWRSLRNVTTIRVRGWRGPSRSILVASAGFLVAGVVLTVYQQVDTVIMSLLVDRDALGWYGTADTLFGSLLFLPTIVMGAVFPVLGRLHADDPDALAPLVKRTASTLLLAAVPIGFGTAAVAVPLAPLLYGEAFEETGPVLRVLGPVLILTSANVLLGSTALATGRQRMWNSFMIAAILLTIPLDLVLVPWTDRTFENGAIGGALAYLVTETMLVILGTATVAPYLVDRAFGWRALRILLAGTAMFGVTRLFQDRSLVLVVLAGMLAYAAAVVLLRVPDDNDRRMLRSALHRVGLVRRRPAATEG
jgi:O-antigen/teichoic acid export membrane protein